MKKHSSLSLVLSALFVLILNPPAGAQGQSSSGTKPLPSIRVHADGHLLETSDGRPFFWLGDTA